LARDKRSLANRRSFQPAPVKSVCDSWPVLQRLAIHQTTTHHWTFHDDVLGYQDLGIQALGAWRFKVEDHGANESRALLDEKGMTVSSLSWAGGFAFHDPEAHQAAVVDGLEAVRTAAIIGASNLIVLPGNKGGYTTNHARKLIIQSIQQLGDAAAEYGVQIALQPVDTKFASDGFFLDSLDKYLDLLRECRHPNVGLKLDVFHLRDTPNLLERIEELQPWIRLVQLSDCFDPINEFDRCPLGEGTLPLEQLVEALETTGYRGFYEVALMSPRIWNSDYEDVIRQIKHSFEVIISCPQP
jgi:sugar phosphate isomerase/epimerase